MNNLFSNCKKLQKLTYDKNKFITKEVTDMSGMFSQCELLTSIDLSNFNTDKCTDMRSMFNDCKELISLDLSK